MSRFMRTWAALGIAAVLALTLASPAQATPPASQQAAKCYVWVYSGQHFEGARKCLTRDED